MKSTQLKFKFSMPSTWQNCLIRLLADTPTDWYEVEMKKTKTGYRVVIETDDIKLIGEIEQLFKDLSGDFIEGKDITVKKND